MRMPRVILLVPLLAALALGGCISGAIYQNTIEPLDTNFDRTQVFSERPDRGDGEVKHLALPIAYARLHFLWDSNAIGDIARRNGLETVHYADLERLNVLGVWRTYKVHVYGR